MSLIIATSSFSSLILWFLLISTGLWPGATLAQFSPAEPAEEQALPLTEEQALARIRAELGQEHGDAALRLIERFLDQSEPPAFIEQFTFLHAAALEAQGQDSQAIVILEQFLEEYPGSRLAHELRVAGCGSLVYSNVQQPGRASHRVPRSWI